MRVMWWLLAVTAVSIVGIVLSQQRALDPLENLFLRVSSPVEGGFRDLADPIADFFGEVSDRGGLVRENERLKEELERLQGDVVAQRDGEVRIRELEAALGVKQSRPDDEFLVANVTARDLSGLKRFIAINRGEGEGVEDGMVVLSRNGSLIGTVSRAYRDFSWVRLVTDPESAVNAQVAAATLEVHEEPVPQGVLEGDLGEGLILELLPADAEVAEGFLVTTSGLGGNYPRALLIGSVESVDAQPQEPFKRAFIEPAATLSSLETVLVLISFRPARLEGL